MARWNHLNEGICESPRDRHWILLCVGLAFVFFTGVILTRDFFADDSYITYRYSFNLVEHGRLTWNLADQDPVEGYTSMVWVLINALAFRVGVDPLIWSKALSASCFIAIIVLLLRNSLIQSKWAKITVVAGLVLVPGSYFHINSGMETVLFSLLVLLIFLKLHDFIHLEPDPAEMAPSIPLLCLLLPMTRPEGAAVAAVAVSAYLFYGPSKHIRKRTLLVFLFFILPGAVYFGWRWRYFGYVFPNPFYVKTLQPLKLGRVLWLSSTLQQHAMVILTTLAAFAFFRRTRAVIGLGLLIVASPILVYALSSSLFMDYQFRFLYHVYPVFLVLFGYSVEFLLNEFAEMSDGGWFFPKAFLAMVFIIFLTIATQEASDFLVAGNNSRQSSGFLGKELKAADIDKQYQTVALGDAGLIPYYSEWNCVDFIGLNDRHLAHAPDSSLGYVLARRPSLILLYGGEGGEPARIQFYLTRNNSLSELLSALESQYERVGWIDSKSGVSYVAFLRNDLPSNVRGRLAEVINVSADNARRFCVPPYRSISYVLSRVGLR